MFKIEPKEKHITKEFLLSKNSAETYFEHYLGIPVKKGLFTSPPVIRKDNKPTASFYKNNKGDLIYKDFAGPTFNFIGAVMEIFKCSYYKAVKIIAHDFGLEQFEGYEYHPPKMTYSGYELKQTEKAIIQVEIKDFSEKELQWWGSFSISLKTLKKFKIYSIKSVFLNGNYTTSSEENVPIYGYYGGENSNGDELWRLYFPTKRKFRFLSNWSSSMMQGARQLPKSSNHCIITKSLKDVAALYELNLISIAPTSETVLMSKSQYNKLKNKYDEIIIFMDNDLAGVKAANKYKKEFPDCRCIFLKRKVSKDISDLYKAKGSLRFIESGEEIIQIIKDKTIRKTKHFYIF